MILSKTKMLINFDITKILLHIGDPPASIYPGTFGLEFWLRLETWILILNQ